MPTPKQYEAKDGAVTWRVRYRDLADRSRSRTFHEVDDAQWFARTIEQHGVTFALRALDSLEAEQRPAGGPILRTVFAEFLDWKACYVRSARTVADYRRQYDGTIDPTLGAEPVDGITPEMVSEWVEAMVSGKIGSSRTGEKMAPKTIAGRHALLHSVMEFAADPKRAYVMANPCTGVKLPKKVQPTPKGLMPAEWQALHAALVKVDQDAADLAAFLIGSGWRWGEAVALTPTAIEDYGTSLYVTMMQVSRRGEASAYNIATDEGKAQKSMRRIKLDSDTAKIIRRRVVGLAPNAPVFTGVDGETGERRAFSYQMFHKRFSRAIRAANLSRRPTIHWLRHTHVAWLAMGGTPLPELQRRIGHASITTTIGTYGSMIGDVSDDALTAFAAMRSGTPRVAQIED